MIIGDLKPVYMKRFISTLLPIFCVAFIMMGADMRPQKKEVAVVKHCSGYTVIEAGLGVDCHGDTVKLVKKYGFYELATRQ
jgi:hypothetical protein